MLPLTGWLNALMFFEMAILPYNRIDITQYYLINGAHTEEVYEWQAHDAIMSEFQFGLEAYGFYVLGSMENYCVHVTDLNFWPMHDVYRAEIGYTYKGAITIGAEHMCEHPVVPNNAQLIPQKNGAYDKIFVRIDLKRPPQK